MASAEEGDWALPAKEDVARDRAAAPRRVAVVTDQAQLLTPQQQPDATLALEIDAGHRDEIPFQFGSNSHDSSKSRDLTFMLRDPHGRVRR